MFRSFIRIFLKHVRIVIIVMRIFESIKRKAN